MTKKSEEGNGIAIGIAMMIGSLGFIALLVLCLFLLIKCSGGSSREEHAVRDTIKVVVYDTIPYYAPQPKDSSTVGFVPARLPINKDHFEDNGEMVDTSTNGENRGDSPDTSPNLPNDSVDVIIPITQKHYEDSCYSAWVSGYKPSLDSIMVYPRTEIRTITIETKESKRWRLGISGGFGVVHDGTKWHCGPGINVGVVCSF